MVTCISQFMQVKTSVINYNTTVCLAYKGSLQVTTWTIPTQIKVETKAKAQ